MSLIEVTNPGVVNAANEAFDGYGHPDQCITVKVPGSPLNTFQGGVFQPGGVPKDFTQNAIPSQVFGIGPPTNVYP